MGGGESGKKLFGAFSPGFFVRVSLAAERATERRMWRLVPGGRKCKNRIGFFLVVFPLLHTKTCVCINFVIVVCTRDRQLAGV